MVSNGLYSGGGNINGDILTACWDLLYSRKFTRNHNSWSWIQNYLGCIVSQGPHSYTNNLYVKQQFVLLDHTPFEKEVCKVIQNNRKLYSEIISQITKKVSNLIMIFAQFLIQSISSYSNIVVTRYIKLGNSNIDYIILKCSHVRVLMIL